MLHNKTALITGASRGIGRAIALLFAHNGCDIAFTDLQHDDAADALLTELQSLGVRGAFYAGDASDFESAHTIVDKVITDFGRLDILVCNAGITRDTLLLRMSEKQWDDVISTNLKSVFNYCHAAAVPMMRQRSGSIIAMSSIVGIAGNAGQANYAASKAGIIGLVKSLSKELGSRNIRANAIAPGFILTDMTNAMPEAARTETVKMIPMRRGGTVDEVASVALFLASDLSSYISGQVIPVNGGMA